MVKAVIGGLFAVGLVCLVFGREIPTPPQKDLSVITRNALHTMRFMKVEAETQLFALVKQKSTSANTDEQSDCVSKVKSEAVTDVSEVLSETVGKIIVDLSKAGEKLANGEKEEVQKWLDEYDYDTVKADARKEFSSKIQNLLQNVESKLEECLKQ